MRIVTYQGPSDRLRTGNPRYPYLYRSEPTEVPNDLADALGKRAHITTTDTDSDNKKEQES